VTAGHSNFWRENMMNSAFLGLFGIINFFVIVGFLGLTVYLYFLMFKLANRGIRALDLYIRDKEHRSL
jgi:uncharacterized membrane protein